MRCVHSTNQYPLVAACIPAVHNERNVSPTDPNPQDDIAAARTHARTHACMHGNRHMSADARHQIRRIAPLLLLLLLFVRGSSRDTSSLAVRTDISGRKYFFSYFRRVFVSTLRCLLQTRITLGSNESNNNSTTISAEQISNFLS